MLCQTCHSNQATVHISSIVFASPEVAAAHFCPACAEQAKGANPALSPVPATLPTVAPKPVTSLALPAKAKIQSIETKLSELDPVWESFCSHRGYRFMPGRELWPHRRALAHNQLDHRLLLTMDVKFTEVLERGFYPDMPWSLSATAAFPLYERARAKPFRPVKVSATYSPKVLTFELFRRLPFSQIEGVLAKQLENAFSILSEVTPEDIHRKGQVPQPGQPEFHRHPW